VPTVRANSTELYYEEAGEGEPLLLMAPTGWPGSVWELEQVPFFRRRFRVITFDYRGVGRSAQSDVAYSTELMADDVLGLLQAVGAEPAHVLAFSIGGRLAQIMARKRPEAFRSLIFAAVGMGQGAPGAGVPIDLAVALATYGYGYAFWLDHLEREPPFSPAFRRKHPEKVRALAQTITDRQAPVETYLKHVVARLRHEAGAPLSALDVPTLVIIGSGDSRVEASRALANEIPNAEFVVVEGPHHLFTWEAPRQANERILQFLERHSGRS
jgi:pimeloyl-ACP methyl ester carboxylesterase